MNICLVENCTSPPYEKPECSLLSHDTHSYSSPVAFSSDSLTGSSALLRVGEAVKIMSLPPSNVASLVGGASLSERRSLWTLGIEAGSCVKPENPSSNHMTSKSSCCDETCFDSLPLDSPSEGSADRDPLDTGSDPVGFLV